MPRGNQITRMLGVLRALEGSRAGLKASELREATGEVASERTIFRDLNQLLEAGFPLASDEDGRWRLVGPAGVASEPATSSEVLALALAEQLLAPATGTDLGEALASLRAKVMARLVPSARALAQELAGAQVATLAMPAIVDDGLQAAAALVEEAIHKEQLLRFRYRSYAGQVTERLVAPHALWFADGQLYAIAHCRLRQAFRVFHVGRMAEVALDDEPFDRDPEFDAHAYVERGFGVWVGEAHDVVLRLSPGIGRLARERRFHATQTVEPRPDGWTELRMHCTGLPVLARWVAGHGGDVHVVAPTELRQMVRDIHQAGLTEAAIKPPVRIRAGVPANRQVE